METLDRLSGYIHRRASDERLTPSHISLYFALCHSWIVNKFQRRYHLSQEEADDLIAHPAQTTYQKAITELKDLGYVRYRHFYGVNAMFRENKNGRVYRLDVY